MSVKRTPDPLGILPPHVFIDPDDDSTEANDAWKEKIEASTPHARVKRLQEHLNAELRKHADELHARLMTEIGLPLANGLHLPPSVHQLNGEDIPELMSAIAEAETVAQRLTLSPMVIRDIARQAGTKKERRPRVTDWFDKKLSKTPDITCLELWNMAPDWMEEEEHVGWHAFKKRFTKAQARRRAASK